VHDQSASDARIPVTVITGALGAGKTTLLNHLLTQTRDRRLAVIVNEFGDAGIDGDLIDTGAEELVELSSGCICCVVRGDLIRTLRDLARMSPAPDGVIIETTGLANPSPVIQTFYADQIIAGHYRLDSVVAVVDAIHATLQLAQSQDTADQIALSDLIVLNKTTGAVALSELERALHAINPFAVIIRTDHGRVNATDLLARHSFDLDRIVDRMEQDAPDHDHGHIASHGITSVSVICDTPLDADALEAWLTDLLSRHGLDIMRIKGIIDCGDPRHLVIQAVHMLMEGDLTTPWPAGPRHSRIVFIGRRLESANLHQGVQACAQDAPN
jgi:G3E family GTPase